MRRTRNRFLGALGACLLLALATVPAGADEDRDESRRPRWLAAWAAPANVVGGLGSGRPADSTVRNVGRISVGGSAVRIRVANVGDAAPLRIGAATVAVQGEGAAVVADTLRPVTFDGQRAVTLPPGTDYVYSDPVALPVAALQRLAVSLYLPDAAPGANAATYNTSYASAAGTGDQTASTDGAAFTTTMSSTYALTAIDVLTTEADGTVVGLGSSSTHGTGSTRDAYLRFIDQLAVRNQELVAEGQRNGVVSAGINGDTLHEALPQRFERDVLSQSGIDAVIVWVINDLASRTAPEIITDYRALVRRAHAAGVRVLCPTWPPGAQSLVAKPTQERSKLNTWILNSGECDDVVDWDAVLRNDLFPDTYRLDYQADTIHFNDAGHTAITDATPLRWFTTRPLKRPDRD